MPATPSGVRGLLLPSAEALPVPKAGDRSVWSARALHAPTLDGLADRAAADLAKPWPNPSARGFARYVRDGDRAEYEDVVFTREHRLTRAAVMAATTLEPAWIDEVVDGVILMCEQSTWCLPAHDDCFARGAAVTDVTRPFLDLRAGDVAGQLAWIDHLLGEQLEARAPGIRARIRHEVDRRVLAPFVTRRDWHWLKDVHNWSAWIHGNVLVAALVLIDDPGSGTRSSSWSWQGSTSTSPRSRRTAPSTRASCTGGRAPAEHWKRLTCCTTPPAALSAGSRTGRCARSSPSRIGCSSAGSGI